MEPLWFASTRAAGLCASLTEARSAICKCPSMFRPHAKTASMRRPFAGLPDRTGRLSVALPIGPAADQRHLAALAIQGADRTPDRNEGPENPDRKAEAHEDKRQAE